MNHSAGNPALATPTPPQRSRSSLEQAFDAERRRQSARYQRTFTSFDKAIGNVVLRATELAMTDVEEDRDDVSFRVVSAPTGSGKSLSTAAIAAAAYKADPQFTCAFVVETIRQAEETFRNLADLVGPTNVTIWTSAHDIKADDDTAEEDHGFCPTKKATRSDLLTARIVVCTHRLWMEDMKTENGTGNAKPRGVLRYRGRRRSVIFVDEHPGLVKLHQITPGDVVKLRDACLDADPDHHWLATLNAVVARMEEAFTATGTTYVATQLIDVLEGLTFAGVADYELDALVSDTLTPETRRVRFEDYRNTCRFLQAASRGCVFLSRQNPISFIAYELEFTPGPGHVLLDATADITGMVALMPGMEEVDVPKVDYTNLSIFHIEQPKEFKFIPEVVKRAKTARPYAGWIKQTVVENTTPGEKVLIAAHKDLFGHQYLEEATNPEAPLDWEGRKVCTVNWGQGIGSNRWKDADAVFLFSEFYVPRAKLIADVQAWTGRQPSNDQLKEASGNRPRGDYLKASEGHLLRWTKQLACRGNVRNIDQHGRCGRMRLYTSMDFTRLTRHQQRLFPGARPPKMITDDQSNGQQLRGIPGLCKLLATTEEAILWAAEVETVTGIATRNLSAKFQSPKAQDAAGLYGWRLSSAKEVGHKGRSKCLVRTP